MRRTSSGEPLGNPCESFGGSLGESFALESRLKTKRAEEVEEAGFGMPKRVSVVAMETTMVVPPRNGTRNMFLGVLDLEQQKVMILVRL